MEQCESTGMEDKIKSHMEKMFGDLTASLEKRLIVQLRRELMNRQKGINLMRRICFGELRK